MYFQSVNKYDTSVLDFVTRKFEMFSLIFFFFLVLCNVAIPPPPPWGEYGYFLELYNVFSVSK